jgi:hypothetical protein
MLVVSSAAGQRIGGIDRIAGDAALREETLQVSVDTPRLAAKVGGCGAQVSRP